MLDPQEAVVLVAEIRRAAEQLSRLGEDFDDYARALAEVSDEVSGSLRSGAVTFRLLRKSLDVLATRVQLANTIPW